MQFTAKEATTYSKRKKVVGLSQSFLDNLYEMYEWITCVFTSFSTVFQSYRDNRRMIM